MKLLLILLMGFLAIALLFFTVVAFAVKFFLRKVSVQSKKKSSNVHRDSRGNSVIELEKKDYSVQ